VAGREITTAGPHAIDALRTNNAFKKVGIGLRVKARPEVLAAQPKALTELSGQTVIPLEKNIGEAARELLPKLKHRYGDLAERLRSLGWRGGGCAALNDTLADLMATDASEAPQQFGAENQRCTSGCAGRGRRTRRCKTGWTRRSANCSGRADKLAGCRLAAYRMNCASSCRMIWPGLMSGWGRRSFYEHAADLIHA
jgi:hypothetical protein